MKNKGIIYVLSILLAILFRWMLSSRRITDLSPNKPKEGRASTSECSDSSSTSF